MTVHMTQHLSRQLCRGVGADRHQAFVFLPGNIAIYSVYAAGRGKNKLFNGPKLCKLKEHLCSPDIDIHVQYRIFNAWSYTCLSSQVYDSIHIVVDFIKGDEAVLSEGLEDDAVVVTLGATELYGSESEFEEE